MREHGINGDEAELLLYRSGTLAFEDCNRDVQQRIRATQQG